jgi:hypothetical protein
MNEEMLRSLLFGGIAILLLASLGACDDPTPTAPGGGGSGGTIGPPPTGGSGGTGSGGTAGNGGSGGGGGAAGNAGAAGNGGDAGAGGVGGIGPTGACNNPLDIAALTSREPQENARAVSARCAITDCSPILGQGEEAFSGCVRDCVGRNIANLSVGCAECYGQLGWCAGLLCNTACEMDPCNEVQCENCTSGGNYPECFTDLNQCAGRPSRDCGPA